MEDSDGNIILIFAWSAVILNCPSLRYTITSDCGLCPNATKATTATCRELSVGDRCVFGIRSAVCSTIVGNINTISVDLKGKRDTWGKRLLLAV